MAREGREKASIMPQHSAPVTVQARQGGPVFDRWSRELKPTTTQARTEERAVLMSQCSRIETMLTEIRALSRYDHLKVLREQAEMHKLLTHRSTADPQPAGRLGLVSIGHGDGSTE